MFFFIYIFLNKSLTVYVLIWHELIEIAINNIFYKF